MPSVSRPAGSCRLREFAEALEARAAELEQDGQGQEARDPPLAELSVAALRMRAEDYRQMAMTATTEFVHGSLQRLARRFEALAEQKANLAGPLIRSP
jgi:hypothetical protein